MNYSTKALAERFWSKVNVGDNDGGCWLWTAAQDRGYGSFGVGSRTDSTRRVVCAPRWAYEYVVGAIPAGLQIDHLCRNPRCVNPLHLEAVTLRTNVLRGIGITARKATQTHCTRGHKFRRGQYIPAAWGRAVVSFVRAREKAWTPVGTEIA